MGVRKGAPTVPASATVADSLLRLAVLLQAGIPPAGAWRHLAESGDVAARRVLAIDPIEATTGGGAR